MEKSKLVISHSEYNEESISYEIQDLHLFNKDPSLHSG